MKIVKRKANLIPYRIVNNQFEFYLSLRSKTAKQYPNCWSFWGGGIEDDEKPEESMIREIKEELDWTPATYEFLGVYYDSMPNEKSIYFTRVEEDFEKLINIRESQGGRFFTKDEIENENKIISQDKKPLFDLSDRLTSS
ncbi:MAG: NUDIX domain-containing protein [Candidatus Pacebacteria bacterium]|nr:NUDIX domain-containing protein [Candidatus Paceibacterota bacterium]